MICDVTLFFPEKPKLIKTSKGSACAYFEPTLSADLNLILSQSVDGHQFFNTFVTLLIRLKYTSTISPSKLCVQFFLVFLSRRSIGIKKKIGMFAKYVLFQEFAKNGSKSGENEKGRRLQQLDQIIYSMTLSFPRQSSLRLSNNLN